MKILALDASTKSTGWAVFKNKELIQYGVITANSKDVIERIHMMIVKIENLLEEFNPDEVVMEEVRPPRESNQGVKTFKALIYLQAAVAFLLHERFLKIKINFVYPSQWRKECGLKNGRGITRGSLKKVCMEYVNAKYNINIKLDDISDAIAIGDSVINKPKELNWE